MGTRGFSYTTDVAPPCSTLNVSIYIAMRIARKYTHRVPSFKELMAEFGMSRATAYRWIRAMREERGTNVESA